MDVFIGENRVLLTGTVVSINDEPIRFKLSNDYELIFQFEHDSSDAKRSCRTVMNPKRLIVTFVNYEANLESANRETIPIGRLNNRPLLLNYSLNFIGDASNHSRITQYTFLEGGVA